MSTQCKDSKFIPYKKTLTSINSQIIYGDHSVISPQNDFSKGFCLGRSHFSKCLRERVLGEISIFRVLPGKEVWFLNICNVCRHFRHENFKIFINHDRVPPKFQFTCPLSSDLMFANLNENLEKKWYLRKVAFENDRGEIVLG